MERALILETTFLVDLERELARGIGGQAQQFLEAHPDHRLYITYTVAGELAAGTSLAERPRWEGFLAPFQILALTVDVCWEYGEAYRYLQQNGLLIGSNDLWIASTAIAYGMPLVTRNQRHFRRVPKLQLADYPGDSPHS